jgi:hypothetical protein
MELKDHERRLKAPIEGIFVKIPPAHQGVADALRAVFTPVGNTLPEDMEALLSRLR